MKMVGERELRQEKRKTACGGIFVRNECWRLSYMGWGLGLGLVIILLSVLRGSIYGFLAQNEPIKSDCVVVEGWLAPGNMAEAAQFIQTHGIHRVFTTGTEAFQEWGAIPGETYGELGKERLALLGVAKEEILAVPCRANQKDRTTIRPWPLENGAARRGCSDFL
jgi:hypothetical protein